MGDLSSHALHNSDSAEPDSDSDSEPNSPRKTEVQDGQRPELVHRFQHDASILCLTTNEERIFAGTQSGEILVFLLDTYQKQHTIRAHHGSVLGLCLSDDEKLLFSSAGDRLVNIWDARSLKNAATVYSGYDVGDIFCVSYSSLLRTVYMGCQNTAIQWHDLTAYDTRPSSDPASHPSLRQNRFFDSPGPGGIRNPQQRACSLGRLKQGVRLLEIPKNRIRQFAHFGYVHCMTLARGLSGAPADSETLITAGGDGAVCLWSLDSSDRGKPVLSARLEDDREDAASVQAIAIEGNFLFAGHVDGEINLWDLETRQLLRGCKAFNTDVLSVTIASGHLFGTSDGGEVKLFNPQYECTQSWPAHAGRVLASVFSRFKKQSLLITGGSDDSIAVWKHDSFSSHRVITQQQEEDDLIESLRAFISYRTVSSDPKYRTECRRGASFLRTLLRRFGATTEMISTEQQCNPIVLAKFRGTSRSAGKPGKRILFYGHYDVIAAENKQCLWLQDPFTMTGRDGFLYGRGASDNKGPIMAAIYAVADVVRLNRLNSDIIFLLEGEEECGSRCFEDAVRRHKDQIGKVDCILVANSYWLDDEIPCLTYGLRGVLHATIQVESDLPDLHSGVDGSRCLDEPLKDLVMLTSKLTGPNGAIHIPGFDDCILPISKAEKALYDEVSEYLVTRNNRLGDAKHIAESLMQRWRQPSLTVHRFKTSGSEKSTLIPHFASVALSLRLVPNQESLSVAKSLRSFLQSEFDKLGSSNSLSMQIHRTAEPWLGNPANDLFCTLERAVKHVWTQQSGRRTSATKPSSPKLNPSHIRQRSSATSSRRPTTLATSATLVSANRSDNDEAVLASPVVRPSSAKGSLPDLIPLHKSTDWRPLYIREGGSIPAIRFLEKAFDAPAAQLPCGQASDNAHLDNERLRVVNLLNSREIFRRVFTELAGQ